MPDGWYWSLVILQFALAVVTAIALQFIVAPYGRHGRTGWGPTVPSRVGWIVMETPAVYLFVAFFLLGEHRGETVPLVFLGLWLLHYFNRSILTPLLTRSSARMPVVVMLLAMGFNALNAWINARWISEYGDYRLDWLATPWFWAGLVLFAFGFWVNVDADRVMRRLRRRSGGAYVLPDAGPHRFVASPNYAGELLEWIGWAVLTLSPAGFAFAAYTAANLAPRAFANRRWLRERFPDYPRERAALIPGVL